MHYAILKWNSDALKWEVIHYTPDLEDFERLALIYPEPQYIHMIDIRYVKSYEIMKNIQEMKNRIAAEKAKQ